MHYTSVPVIVLSLLALFARSTRAEENDPEAALIGEWEIVEMVFKARFQDFGGKPGGWFRFERGSFTLRYQEAGGGAKFPSIVRPREIDFLVNPLRKDLVSKALYQFKDGTLRIIWREDGNERPTHFDAYRDPKLTLFVLNRIK